MSQSTTSRISFLVVALLCGATAVNGCAAVSDEELDEETMELEYGEPIGEAESQLINSTGSGRDPDFCGWFCPVWAKDLSDCLMIPCKAKP
jgi:hypothetical protein